MDNFSINKLDTTTVSKTFQKTAEKEDENSIFDKNEVQTSKEEIDSTGAKTSVPFLSKVIGKIIDFFDGDTKDGKIDPTKQGSANDCWLLAGVEALNKTPKGKEIIKNSLEYEEGKTTVHLTFGDYTVTDEELLEAKGSFLYSTGDDDMAILELAVEKLRDDIAQGKIELPEDTKNFINSDNIKESKTNSSSLDIGTAIEAWYFLTGEKGTYTKYKDETDEMLNNFKENENTALVGNIMDFKGKNSVKFSFFSSGFIKDADGKYQKLSSSHSYAIKEVTDNTVTISNPQNSKKEITLSKEQYLELFDYTCELDME